jgi:HK97 family phage major capsid protein
MPVTLTDEQAKSIISGQRAVQKGLEALASQPAAGRPGGHMMYQDPNVPWNQGASWPDQLKALKPYDHAAVNLLCKSGRGRRGNLRVSGAGPAFIKMAALAGNQGARAVARSMGMSDGYEEEAFEKEHGFCTIAKAAKYGVPNGNSNERRKTALAEGSGITGGYVIPPQFQSNLLTIAAEDGFIEPRAEVIPMNTRTVEWPMLDITTVQAAGTSPYFGGILASWQPEAATINETEPQFKQSTWTAWDLMLYTVSSNQLLADNGIGLDALLTQLFGQAITWYKEFAFLQGKGAGSSMPLGILNAPATLAQNRNTPSRFLLQDAAAMLSHLQIRSWDDACWIMHQSVIPQLIQMVGGGTIGTPSTTNIPGNALVWLSQYTGKPEGPLAMKLPQAFLNGLPVYFTEKLPSLGTKGDVMLVDWSRYVIGTRLDMQIDVSPHYLFRNNQLAWRVISRCDGKPWLNSFITDQTGWQISPFVVLN